jgi:hypothetical protein
MTKLTLSRIVLFSGLALILIAGSWRASVPTAVMASSNMVQQPSPTAGGPTKRALLIGINNYKYPNSVSPLAGSLNDVEDMRQVLIGKFEFLPENIMVLKDAQATHAQIMSAIQTQLVANTKAGDIVVFHYSGHGSQMKDLTGKMISGLDETIVPYDSRDPEGKVLDISGAELHLALVQIAKKTKNVTFILDSCHSGTLVRGARVRSIAADTRSVSPAQVSQARAIAATDDGSSPKFAFIAAATSKENAFEHYAEGKDHGSLTYFLTRQLRSARAGATYRDVMDNVSGNVTANYPGQHPSLEGAEPDQHVFGDATSLTGSYAVATPSAINPKGATINLGQIQGATVGSIYDVYTPGSRKFAPPERPTASVRLTSVDASTSEGAILAGGKVAAGSRAIEKQHRYTSPKARIFLDGVDQSPFLQSVQTGLADIKSIEFVDRPSACNIRLRQAGETVQSLAADSSTLSTPVSINDPNAVATLRRQMQDWAKWFNVLAIHNTQSAIDIGFTLGTEAKRDVATRVGRPDMGVAEGDKVLATLVNNSERDLYVAVLDISGDGSISVVYPVKEGAKEVLKAHTNLVQSFFTTLPKGRAQVTDSLKMFASYKPVDLSPLQRKEIRGIDEAGAGPSSIDLNDPLQMLLEEADGGTRGVSTQSGQPVEPGTWATVQRVLLIRRKR